MKNKYKAAGGWNIACGLSILLPMLFAVSVTGLLTWLSIEAEAGIAMIFLLLTATFGAALIPSLIASIAFIAVGIALRSKKRKKWLALKIFLALHII